MSGDKGRKKELDDFVQVIYSALCTLDKNCTEKDLRKAYRENQGHNINQMIDKVRLQIYLTSNDTSHHSYFCSV
jgi:hypothetical protein